MVLHARSVSFTHPVSGKRLTFETAIPDLFTRLVGNVPNAFTAHLNDGIGGL
jgi:hypothetical protein